MKKAQNFFRWLLIHPKIFFFVSFLLLSLIVEILYNRFNMDPFVLFCSIAGILITAVFVSPIKKKISNLFQKANKSTIKNKRHTSSIPKSSTPPKASSTKNLPVDNAIIIVYKCFTSIAKIFMRARNSGTILIILVILFLSFTSSVAAYNHLWGTIFHSTGQFFSSMSYENPTLDNQENNNTNDNNQEDNNSFSSDDNIYIEEDMQLGFLTNPNHLINLSENESEWLYFTNKSILNSDNDRDVAQKLLPFLQSILSQQHNSNFDETSPTYIQKMIEQASATEIIMENSDDLDTVITMRSNVWNNGYKTYTIAFLLSNNMQKYAQEYLEANGQFETIKYYYAYSIFWSWRSLTLESVSQYDFTTTLNYIAMRYKDIAYVAPNGSWEQQQAKLISDAFEIIAEETNYEAIKNGTATIE